MSILFGPCRRPPYLPSRARVTLLSHPLVRSQLCLCFPESHFFSACLCACSDRTHCVLSFRSRHFRHDCRDSGHVFFNRRKLNTTIVSDGLTIAISYATASFETSRDVFTNRIKWNSTGCNTRISSITYTK